MKGRNNNWSSREHAMCTLFKTEHCEKSDRRQEGKKDTNRISKKHDMYTLFKTEKNEQHYIWSTVLEKKI